jgi:phosphoribosylaminoimidazolecarboxamide formyltransferase/IMP cyclohydrolase
VTKLAPTDAQVQDLLFANKLAKHLKSNTIVLAKDQQLLSMGCGQTSRVDALQQAINKAKAFGFDLQGCVMASDAFFPFPDCVEIADKCWCFGGHSSGRQHQRSGFHRLLRCTQYGHGADRNQTF